jgi:hypothetical protein
MISRSLTSINTTLDIIFGDFSNEELNLHSNKIESTDRSTTISNYESLSFFADESPYIFSQSIYSVLSTISKNPDEIIFGNFPSNPQCPCTPESSPTSTPQSSPPSSPKKYINLVTEESLVSVLVSPIVFTYHDIIDWINYEKIMLYNKTAEYAKEYRNQNTEKTIKLIKEQREMYELEKHLRNIYMSTHNIIYNV